MPVDVQPLSGILVVELAWYLPIAHAGRELARLGARVVRVEAPEGDPLRQAAPAWDRALRGGKESVVCDLKADAAFARSLCVRADVVLEGLRPGVAARLGIGPDDLPASLVHCSITGFGSEGRHARRAGHDLNYLGWAGALEDTPSCPPLQIADLAAGALGAVTEVLAALVRRANTGEGARLCVSMTHRSHGLVDHRLGGDPRERMLTGGLACYRVYATADSRYLTLAALGVSAPDAVMVGDSYEDDIEGARALGMRAILLDRDERYPAELDRITDLQALPAALGLAPGP